eukprot:533772-Pelagomonas_calceolata.AAC.5
MSKKVMVWADTCGHCCVNKFEGCPLLTNHTSVPSWSIWCRAHVIARWLAGCNSFKPVVETPRITAHVLAN